MTFCAAFRQALLTASGPLLACMELLWIRNDYVNIDELSTQCARSASHVMGRFSRKFSEFGNDDDDEEVRRLYLDEKRTDDKKRVVAYRLKGKLRDIVEEVLREREIL